MKIFIFVPVEYYAGIQYEILLLKKQIDETDKTVEHNSEHK